jgi:A/G-specific adenine glycosylase
MEQPVAVVDTNIARVLARVSGSRMSAKQVQAAADAALDRDDPWAWNQTLMDIGALACRPEPSCGTCPLRSWCAYAGGDRDIDPADGSAGVSTRQARFEGSDRQGRGRLMRAMGDGPVPCARLADAMGWPGQGDRAERVAVTLVRDGLAVLRDGTFQLP